jgi:hypothetical protein
MTPLIPQIDHVVINVMAKLNEAAAQFQRLGFQLTERGHHTLGTSNNLAIFGTDYLELLGYEEGNAAKRPDVWHYPPGLSGLVFKPPAAPGFPEELNAAGVPAELAREFSRPVNLPGGAQDARFRTVNLIDATPNGRVFFCHHYTPDLVWRDEWRQHANGATDIVEFTIATADPARSAAVFGRMFGAAALHPVAGGLSLPTSKAKILFLTPDTVAQHYGGAAPAQADGSDRMVALGLRTASLDAASAALRHGGIADVTEIPGGLVVPASSACGLALAFMA